VSLEFTEGNATYSGVEQTARLACRELKELGRRKPMRPVLGVVFTVPAGARGWRWVVVEKITRRGVDVVYTTPALMAQAQKRGRPIRFLRSRLPRSAFFEGQPGMRTREARTIGDVWGGGQQWIDEEGEAE
jgi:hypothetical protein